MKQARDCLRTDNIRLHQKGGLVSHSGLLRDFEEKRDQVKAICDLSQVYSWQPAQIKVHECDFSRLQECTQHALYFQWLLSWLLHK